MTRWGDALINEREGKCTEGELQEAVAGYLDSIGVLWCHVPNEGKMKPQYGAKRKRQGVKAGVPDCLVFTEPRGAIELKVGKNRLQKSQSEWLSGLESQGWATHVCRSLNEVTEVSQTMGWAK